MLKSTLTKVFTTLCLFHITLNATNPQSLGTRSSLQADSPIYNLGDYAEGGVIFYLTPDGQHGLVASIVDMTDGFGNYELPWDTIYSLFVTIGAKADFITFGEKYTTGGKINTNLIVKTYGTWPNYAAGACVNYSHDIDGKTYNDWYLPCLAELGLMREMKETINSISVAHGGTAIQTNIYWSSVETLNVTAWCQDFDGVSQLYRIKADHHRVRAVRAF